MGVLTILRVRRLGALAVASLVTAALLVTGITPAAQAAPGDATLQVRVTTPAGVTITGAKVSAVRIGTGGVSVQERTVAASVTGGMHQLALDASASWAIRVDTTPLNVATNVTQFYGGASTLGEARPYRPALGTSTLQFALLGGSIGGVVTNPAKKPLPGVDVHLYRWNGSWNLQKTTTTSAKGAYSFPYLQAGSYTTQFDPTIAQRSYVSILAGGTPVAGNGVVPSNIGKASPLVVRFGAPVTYSPRLAVGGTITGRALAGGIAAAGVKVRAVALTGSAASGWTSGVIAPVAAVTSTASGAFSISGLPAGTYALSLSPNSALSSGWRDPYADPAPLTTGLQVVTVAAGRASAASSAASSLVSTGAAANYQLSGRLVGLNEFSTGDAKGTVSFGRPGDFDATVRTATITTVGYNATFGIRLAPGVWEYHASPIGHNGTSYHPVWGTVVVGPASPVLEIPFGQSPTGLAFANPGLRLAAHGPVTVGTTLEVIAESNYATTSRLDYQWLRNGIPIFGARSATYTARGDDVGASITVRVMINELQRGSSTSDVTDPVVVSAAAAPVNTAAPVIAGTPKPGSRLTASAGQWDVSPLAFSYSWQRNGIPVAAGSSYLVTAADADATISVSVTASRAGHIPAPAVPSAGVTVVRLPAPAAKTAPKVTAKALTLGAVRYTATGGAWTPAATSYAYRWLDGDTESTGASYTASTPGTAVSVQVIARRAGHVDAVRTIVVRRGPAPVGSATLSGPAVVGTPLTVALEGWPESGVGYSYSWQRYASRRWIAVGSAPGYTPTALDLGKPLRVVVSVTSARTTTASRVLAAGATAPGAAAVGTVEIRGAAIPVMVHTAVPTWSGAAPTTVSYQWLRDGVPIAKATAASYSPPAAFAGSLLSVRVTGARPGYTTAIASQAVTLGEALFLTVPVVTTTGLRSEVHVETVGDIQYGWNRSDTADAPTYVREADNTNPLYVTFGTEDFTITLLAVRGTIPASTLPIGGTGRVGGVLTAPESPLPAVTRQWYSNGVAIKGATKATFTPSATYLGKKITVRSVASQADYVTSRTTSAAKTVTLGSIPGAAVITGAPRPSAVLTADTTGLAVSGLTVSYQWQASTGGAFASIKKATAKTYRPTVAQIGQQLRVVVTARRAGYTTNSGATAAVTVQDSGALTPTALPALLGTGAAGTVLTVTPPAFAATGVSYAYRWLRNGTVMPGVTGASFVTSGTMFGDAISVEVTARAAGYQPWTGSVAPLTVSLGAAPTATKANVPKLTGGTATCGSITATTGIWSLDGLEYSYQWYRIMGEGQTPQLIAGATAQAYAVPTSGLLFAVGVEVTAKRSGHAIGVAKSAYLAEAFARVC